MGEHYAAVGVAVGVAVTLAARVDTHASVPRIESPTQVWAAPAVTAPASAAALPTLDRAERDSVAPTWAAILHVNPVPNLPIEAELAVTARARLEVERVVRYDASYRLLPSYPNGDIPSDRGACTDLVIRAFRAVNVDLQVLVHEDILAAPEAYDRGPRGDANIDHRRVPTLYAYFVRNALSLDTDRKAHPEQFRPGDVIFFARKRCYAGWPCVPDHVAIVSDRIGARNLPLLLQNGGPVATESDGLDSRGLVGHFRLNAAFYAANAGGDTR
jgi:uncharacterized protein